MSQTNETLEDVVARLYPERTEAEQVLDIAHTLIEAMLEKGSVRLYKDGYGIVYYEPIVELVPQDGSHI